jgi:hypothetical protein
VKFFLDSLLRRRLASRYVYWRRGKPIVLLIFEVVVYADENETVRIDALQGHMPAQGWKDPRNVIPVHVAALDALTDPDPRGRGKGKGKGNVENVRG